VSALPVAVPRNGALACHRLAGGLRLSQRVQLSQSDERTTAAWAAAGLTQEQFVKMSQPLVWKPIATGLTEIEAAERLRIEGE
jgi:hypothetical protein